MTNHLLSQSSAFPVVHLCILYSKSYQRDFKNMVSNLKMKLQDLVIHAATLMSGIAAILLILFLVKHLPCSTSPTKQSDLATQAAFECDKTLAIVKRGPKKNVVNCTLFDLVKRSKVGKRFFFFNFLLTLGLWLYSNQ